MSRQREWMEKMIAAGNCPQCGKPAMEGYRHCAECNEKYRIRLQKLFARRRDEGRCPQCGKPNDTEKSYCSVCLKKNKENRMRNYRQCSRNGLCHRCGKPRGDSPFKVQCVECGAATQRYYLARRAITHGEKKSNRGRKRIVVNGSSL